MSSSSLLNPPFLAFKLYRLIDLVTTSSNRNYSVSIPKEESATIVPGEKPLWIDVEEESLKEALELCREQTLNDRRSDLVLLYDKSLSEHLVRQLAQLKRPRKEGGFGWKKVVPWESFVGGECDTVVYVGSGSLEAFSRARLKLMIITISPREQRGPAIVNFYAYNAGLKNSVEKNLLERKIIKHTREDSLLLDIVQETLNETQNDLLENQNDSEQTPLLSINQSR